MGESTDEISDDAIFNGAVTVRQRREGYRFSLDALLLAWYASLVPATRALELGTGCGVVSLALMHKLRWLRIDAVEIQETLHALARENAAANGFSGLNVVRADLRELSGPDWEGRYDLVFSNPPYRRVGRGRLNPEPEKARARHELLATLDDVLSCCGRTLRPGGSAALVLLAEREPELQSKAGICGLHVVHRCRVRPYADKEPNILLARLALESAAAVGEGLVVYNAVGEYTPSARAVIDGEWDKVRTSSAGPA